MKINKYKLLLFLILLLASFIRLWKLDSIPNGFIPDEADMGYSAYSILETGLSQYGTFNPLAIQEFSGGSHPPLYTYALMPLIKLFGLNLFLDRLPSAIFGILTVLIVYLITKKLFNNEKVSLISALLITINPWAIHISRQGLLESISLFFVSLGILFFLKVNDNKYYLLISAFVLGLSLFSYDAPKVFLPFIIIVLIFYQWKHLRLRKQLLFGFFIIFSFFYLLIIKGIIFDGNLKDYSMVSAFRKQEIENSVNSGRTLTYAPLWLSGIFHNKLTEVFGKFTYNYSTIFSINWFYLNGQGDFHKSVGTYGEFHIFEVITIFIGFYLLFKKRKKEALFLLAWILIGALPGGITNPNNPYRVCLLIPAPIIISAYGILYVLEQIKQMSFYKKNFLIVIILIFISFFTLKYFTTYFLDYPVYASDWWRVNENKMLKYVWENKYKYKYVFIDNRLENSYSFMNKIDPRKYQKAYLANKKYKDTKIISIDNVYFGYFSDDFNIKNYLSEYFPEDSLVIINGDKFENNVSIMEFKDVDNMNILYRVFEVKKI